MKNLKKSQDEITISNACENNLKNLSLTVPKNSFVLVTGLSGSGKSTLVNDVIASEARRRFLEQFNPRVRTLMARIRRPDVDLITGLSPVISVDQISGFHQIRSTVGTLSGLYDYLRLLFARYGQSDTRDGIQLTRSHFSFNTPEGQCPTCLGIGKTEFIDPNTFIVYPERSIRDGALSLTTPTGYVIYSQVTIDVLAQVCEAEGFSVNTPWNDLTADQKNIIFYGSEAIKVPFGKHTLESRMKWTGITARPRDEGHYRGVLTIMEEILKRDRNKNILKYTRSKPCRSCQGYRLNQQALRFQWGGMNIGEWSDLDIAELHNKLSYIKETHHHSLTDGERTITDAMLRSSQRILSLGLGYLTLNRDARSLSPGESKRLKISSVLQPGMSGIIYTIDEPTVGLHPANHQHLLKSLRELCDAGNSVLCIDHKFFGFAVADHWIEIGPGAGVHGGELIINQSLLDIRDIQEQLNKSVTWSYLSGATKVERQTRPIDPLGELNFVHCKLNNLQDISPRFYQNRLNTICGVSGAGKTSLLAEIGHQAKHFKKVIEVDQKPIGRTPRSNPATYTKIFDHIRDVFAQTQEAAHAGLTKSHFSFNVEGGRCPDCMGAGKTEIGLSYLGKIETDCETCLGKRFNPAVLEVKWKDKNVHEVLEMDVDAALLFFNENDKISRPLQLLHDLGLGYLRLGQSSNTLSGGEAQRIKLVAELIKAKGGGNLYLLDEPTNGLHYSDIQILLKGLDNLLDKKNTIIVIEHDPVLVMQSDWITELGPGAGSQGGSVIFAGTAEQLKSAKTPMAAAIGNGTILSLPRNKFVSQGRKVQNMSLEGVSTHNLKNISVDIPVQKITAISGPSGSGKTSLAYDTLYELSRFLYSQAFSTYIQTLISGNRPGDIQSYHHILPAIGIRYQRSTSNKYSTVGTLLGILPKVRLLFSRFAKDKKGHTSGLWSNHFSYQDPAGACDQCEGLGFHMTTDEEHLVSDSERTIASGAFSGSKPGAFFSDPQGQYYAIFEAMAKEHGIPADIPWKAYDEQQKSEILGGTGDRIYEVNWRYKRRGRSGEHHFQSAWKGFIPLIREDYEKKKTTTRLVAFDTLMFEESCSKCQGWRINPNMQQYMLGGLSIGEWGQMTLIELGKFLTGIGSEIERELPALTVKLIADIIQEIREVLDHAIRLNLGYLNLLRRSDTLSSGEYQRIRIIGQLSSGLNGILYVIDEPGATLPADNLNDLADLLEELRDQGNTIVLTDHHQTLLRRADHRICLGPRGGQSGGQLVAPGEQEGRMKPTVGRQAGFDPRHVLISQNNVCFRNLNIAKLKIPKGWTSISGVSGSGKSSLVNGVILRALSQNGYEYIHLGEQSKRWTWRQSPLNMLGLDQTIFKKLAATEIALQHQLKVSHFTPGNKAGACPVCLGRGVLIDSLDFLGESARSCYACQGSGYQSSVLKPVMRGMNICDLLQTDLSLFFSHFEQEPAIDKIREAVTKVGLGYLKTGQHGHTLSSGERQRLMLVRHLMQRNNDTAIIVLDEPARGLDEQSIMGYIDLLVELLNQGSSIITIDHQPKLIAQADWNIRLGPGAGSEGGRIIYEGRPQ